MNSIERLSIDLSNYCSKACNFCYNQSSTSGATFWNADDVISLALDCIHNGTQAVSLGGGEPFEFAHIFDLIEALNGKCYLSVTSNGEPLDNPKIWNQLKRIKPDKIHLSIHDPENVNEVRKTYKRLMRINTLNIGWGINVLVSANKIAHTKKLVQWLYLKGVSPKQLIFIPRKFSQIPTQEQIAEVAGIAHFQSASCLTECKPSARFCSVSYDKKVSFCSYSPTKALLHELTFAGIISALETINFKTCMQ